MNRRSRGVSAAVARGAVTIALILAGPLAPRVAIAGETRPLEDPARDRGDGPGSRRKYGPVERMAPARLKACA